MGKNRRSFVGIDLSPEAIAALAQEEPEFSLTPVPPPKVAPVHDQAAAFGLTRGLRPKEASRECKCGSCRRKIESYTWGVWVPDHVRESMTADQVTELARVNTYNGHWTFWCMECALRLSNKKAPAPEGRSSFNPDKYLFTMPAAILTVAVMIIIITLMK
jgi:hypothetical protein